MRTPQERRALQEQRKREGQQRFTEPLTAKRAGKIASNQTNLAYRDTMRQNAGLIRASKQREQEVGGWYQNFANEIAASRGAVQGAYDQANTAIAGNIATAGADDTARQAAVMAADQKQAQLTGAPVNTQGAQTSAAAGQQRALYGSALAAPVATQGANSFAYLTNQGTAAKGEGLKQRVGEGKRRLGLQQDRSALLKERGNYLVSKLSELRGQERDYGIQKAAFGLDKKTAAQDAQDAAFDNSIAARNAATAERNAATTEKNAAGGGSGGMSPSEQRSAQAGRQNAMAAAKQKVTEFGKPGSAQEWAELQAAIAEEEGVDPREAKWAVDRLKQKWGWKPKGNQLPVKAW